MGSRVKARTSKARGPVVPGRGSGTASPKLINMEKVEIDGVTLYLSHPEELPLTWVGQQELMDQMMAAWLLVEERDRPLHPRLIGKPGVGKTTLAYAAGKKTGRDVYLFQATVDTRPEDLLITPVVAGSAQIRYMASPLVTAMIKGGTLVLDEGNRMSEKSWASLAPLLDDRRYVESIVAGIKVQAHPEFRLVVTMNDDASTFEIPEYIHSRLMPQIFIDFPEAEEEKIILEKNLPFADEQLLDYLVSFLQLAHASNERYTVRDGINLGRYALKLSFSEDKSDREPTGIHSHLIKACLLTLGQEALIFFKQ